MFDDTRGYPIISDEYPFFKPPPFDCCWSTLRGLPCFDSWWARTKTPLSPKKRGCKRLTGARRYISYISNQQFVCLFVFVSDFSSLKFKRVWFVFFVRTVVFLLLIGWFVKVPETIPIVNIVFVQEAAPCTSLKSMCVSPLCAIRNMVVD